MHATAAIVAACLLLLLLEGTAAVVSETMTWADGDGGVETLEMSSPVPDNQRVLCCALLIELAAVLAAAAANARTCEKSSLMPVRRGNLCGE